MRNLLRCTAHGCDISDICAGFRRFGSQPIFALLRRNPQTFAPSCFHSASRTKRRDELVARSWERRSESWPAHSSFTGLFVQADNHVLVIVPPHGRFRCPFHHSLAADRPAIDRISLRVAVRCKQVAFETDPRHISQVLRVSHEESRSGSLKGGRPIGLEGLS